jgi:SAM-dependent methyltransferase
LRQLGLTKEQVGEITRIGAQLPDPTREPMRRWHLRRLDTPVAYAMRMLVFADSVTEDEAKLALGEISVDDLVQAGLLIRQADGGLVSPFYLNVVNELYVICDDLVHGGAAVMGAGETTADLCQAAYPTRPIERALDLGCGSGTAALLFAARTSQCIGVDVNPRAIILARVNAALNGLTNLEFRRGDLFQPVADETFDLIVSQPPFVSLPPATKPAMFLHGGARGDEFALRLLTELPDRLTAKGRAYLLVEWPVVDEQPLEQRVREAVGSNSLSVLLLRFPETDLDDYCTRYSAAEHSSLGKAFEQQALRIRDHLEQMGIYQLRLALAVLDRGGAAPGWTATVDVPPTSTRAVTSARIDTLLAARDLLAQGDQALLASSLHLPETILAVERPFDQPGPERIRLRFPEHALVHGITLNPDAQLLISHVHAASNVRAAVDAFATERNLTTDASTEAILNGVKQALLRGILEPAPPNHN